MIGHIGVMKTGTGIVALFVRLVTVKGQSPFLRRWAGDKKIRPPIPVYVMVLTLKTAWCERVKRDPKNQSELMKTETLILFFACYQLVRAGWRDVTGRGVFLKILF